MKNIEEEKIKKYLKRLAKATLMDDLIFRQVCKSKGAVEEILRAVLNDNKLKVIECIDQRNRSSALYHGVILDCECKLKTKEIVNVEVQIALDDNPVYRMRYNQSVITIENSPKNKDFKYKEIPKIISIMFCDFDLFKRNEVLYEITRIVNDDKKTVSDNGIREIYININGKTKNKNINELLKIIKDIKYDNGKEYKELSNVKNIIKRNEIGGKDMSGIARDIFMDGKKLGREEGMEKGIEQGRQEGMQKGTLKTLLGLVEKGLLSIAVAAKELGMTENEFKKLMA